PTALFKLRRCIFAYLIVGLLFLAEYWMRKTQRLCLCLCIQLQQHKASKSTSSTVQFASLNSRTAINAGACPDAFTAFILT
ncbi:hypothetical protein KI387_001561, partial [Taxus chinensis]